MKRRSLFAALVALVASLTASGRARAQPTPPPAPSAPPPPLDEQRATDELKALLEAQAKQWTAGDLEGFCSHYAEDCLFLSPGGVTRGRKDVLDRYKKKYVDKAAMGRLTLEVVGARTSATTQRDGAGGAFASVAMQWTLSYTDRPKASGYSLIALEKRSDRWKIVHDASM